MPIEAVDLPKLQDSVMEMATRLLMLDVLPLLEALDAQEAGKGPEVVRFASREKMEAFHKLVVAIYAAKCAAGDLRKAHIEEWRRIP